MEDSNRPQLLLRLGTALAILVVWYCFRKLGRKPLRLPPGPSAWPLVGNIPHFGSVPHRSLTQLSKKYGPLMLLKLGSNPMLVASSADVTRELLKTQGDLFASRINSLANGVLSYGRRSIGVAPYGPEWFLMRKICVMELLSVKRLEQFKDVRREEILAAVENILAEGKEGHSVEINEKLLQINNNNITRMLFSKTYCEWKTTNENIPKDAMEFRDLIQKTVSMHMEFFIGDFIPSLKGLDFKGIKPRMLGLRRRWDAFFEEIFRKHRPSRSEEGQETSGRTDFVDVLLSIQKAETKFSDDLMKGLLKALILGGTDTAANVSAWTILEIAYHPQVQKKLHEELDAVVGTDRLVEDSDIPNLPYLQAVVKESFRLHPVLPLLVPHESINSRPVTLGGYDIPANCGLLINAFAIQRDPSVWEKPLQFDPERFVNSTVEVKGQHFDILPFGSGRRICPGMNMGLAMVHLTVAQMFHAFEWQLAPEMAYPETADELEFYRGLSVPKSVPYKIAPRLPLPLFAM